MAKFIKKYWVILLFILAIIFGILIGKAITPTNALKAENTRLNKENKMLLKKHRSDSLFAVASADSMNKLQIVQTKLIASLKNELSIQKNKNKQKVEDIKKLTPTEQVALFQDITKEETSLVKKGDSLFVMTTLPGIVIANEKITQGDGCEEELQLAYDLISAQDSAITLGKELNNIKDQRIVNLTDDFYRSQNTITGLNIVNKEYSKKIKTKNLIIGGLIVTTGAAAIITTIALIH